jgi:hypothetical protein
MLTQQRKCARNQRRSPSTAPELQILGPNRPHLSKTTDFSAISVVNGNAAECRCNRVPMLGEKLAQLAYKIEMWNRSLPYSCHQCPPIRFQAYQRIGKAELAMDGKWEPSTPAAFLASGCVTNTCFWHIALASVSAAIAFLGSRRPREVFGTHVWKLWSLHLPRTRHP